MSMRTRAMLAVAMLLAGCAAGPSINVKHRIPHGGTLAVVMFQDCSIANQADCGGSGAKAGAIFVRVLAERPGLHTVALNRPVAATAALDDAAAIAYAKAKGYRYVVNGEVQDYRGSGSLALRAPRAAVSLRVLNTANGQAWATYSYQEQSSTRLAGPDALLEEMAKQVAAAIILEKKGERPGNFLLYKQKPAGE
jgi:TolB-like protein